MASIRVNNPLRYSDPDGKDWQPAWSDVKSFVGSIQIKFSGGLGGKVGIHAGSDKAEASGAVKGNYTLSLGGPTKSTTSLTAEVGVQAGPSAASGGQNVGESVTVEKAVGSFKSDNNTFGEAEPATLTKTDTLGAFGGNSTATSSSDGRLGLGVELGEGVVGGVEISTSKSGLGDLKDFFSQVKDEIVPPSAPLPQPPSPPQPAICAPNSACP